LTEELEDWKHLNYPVAPDAERTEKADREDKDEKEDREDKEERDVDEEKDDDDVMEGMSPEMKET
jgi:ribosomal protein L12E/L44/L45/RPP1/RPP2